MRCSGKRAIRWQCREVSDTRKEWEDVMTFDTRIERLPESIRKAWGDDVAVEFITWLTAILQDRPGAAVTDSPHVQVAPAYARRRVNGLMLDRVSHLLLAGEPRLTYTDRRYWRVPVDLTFPSKGRVGSVGEVDVDATLGEVMVDDELLAQIAQRADRLARAV
jgi:hypothetical protein